MSTLENEKLLTKACIGLSFNINDRKNIMVNHNGTEFFVRDGDSVLYKCELEMVLTETYKSKFIFKNPFDDNVIFDCTENIFWQSLSWIFIKETDMEIIKNEIS